MKRLTEEERIKITGLVQQFCDSKAWLGLARNTPRYRLTVMIPDELSANEPQVSEEVINIINQFRYKSIKHKGYTMLQTYDYSITYIYNKILSK